MKAAKKKDDRVAFGVLLRAARLRFFYVSAWDGFIRVSDKGKNFFVEIRPNKADQLNKAGSKTLYRNLEDPNEIIQQSPVLRAIRKVHKAFDLVLDSDGNTVCDSLSQNPPMKNKEI